MVLRVRALPGRPVHAVDAGRCSRRSPADRHGRVHASGSSPAPRGVRGLVRRLDPPEQLAVRRDPPLDPADGPRPAHRRGATLADRGLRPGATLGRTSGAPTPARRHVCCHGMGGRSHRRQREPWLRAPRHVDTGDRPLVRPARPAGPSRAHSPPVRAQPGLSAARSREAGIGPLGSRARDHRGAGHVGEPGVLAPSCPVLRGKHGSLGKERRRGDPLQRGLDAGPPDRAGSVPRDRAGS